MLVKSQLKKVSDFRQTFVTSTSGFFPAVAVFCIAYLNIVAFNVASCSDFTYI
jgi:hypothetical protein